MLQRYARWVKPALSILFLALVIIFLWRNWGALAESLKHIRDLPAYVYVAGLMLFSGTVVLAALSYRVLAFNRLPMSELLIVEVAAGFMNKIVPAGLGTLGTHGVYLHNRQHNAAQATTVISVNNFLSLVTHLGLLGLALLAGAGDGVIAAPGRLSVLQLLIVLTLFAACAGAVYVRPVRLAMRTFARHMLESLDRYRKKPRSLLLAATSLTIMTTVNVAILTVIALSLGISLSAPDLLVVYSAGVLVGAATPTPGGLVGVEAGLAAGFMAYGVDKQIAFAAALAFRLVTYWFPLIPGFLALVWARKLKLLSSD